VSTNKNLREAHVRDAPRRRVQFRWLATLLARRGLTYVDCLSPDIEGAELGALQSVD